MESDDNAGNTGNLGVSDDKGVGRTSESTPPDTSSIPDNRNIIKLEDLKKEKGDEEIESKKFDAKVDTDEVRYLDDSEIKNLIYSERGKIPSVILDDIYDSLKGRRVTKKQIKRIISKVKENLDTESKIEKIDDLYKKLEALEKLLRNLSKAQLAEKSETSEAKKPKDSEVSEAMESEVKEFDSGTQETETPEFDKSEVYGESPELGKPGGIIQEVNVDSGSGGIGMRVINEGILRSGIGEMGGMDEMGGMSEASKGRINGIRLTTLPADSKRIIFLLKWIEYLVERVGYDELENALDYYVDIGWISEEVLFSILRYAKGIKLYHEKSDWRPVGYLNVQDHIMSLMFIEALKTGRFSKEKIMEVEREVFRMKREAMELNGI